MMDYAQQFEADRKEIEAYLAEYLDGLWPFGNLVDAMGYSLLSGGKRIRPVLTLAAARYCGGEGDKAMPLATALEMVHTYSLIHDDLPCMDDDDLRRGKPTNHKIYGQATAVLAGDALLTNAFGVIAEAEKLAPKQIAAAVSCLASAAGSGGMVAGQVLDMQSTGGNLTVEQLRVIESLKTGKLMVAAVQLGAIAAGAGEAQTAALTTYAEKIGLAFQIQDDLLDEEGDEVVLGKPIGSDAANGKRTFVTLTSADQCRTMVEELTREAIVALGSEENGGYLRYLAEMLVVRTA